jgi:hypothetical protein
LNSGNIELHTMSNIDINAPSIRKSTFIEFPAITAFPGGCLFSMLTPIWLAFKHWPGISLAYQTSTNGIQHPLAASTL